MSKVTNKIDRVDSIINAGWLIPILPHKEILAGHSVAITDGKISNIFPKEKAIDFVSKEVFDLPNHVLLPGLVNCHGHAAMSLLRGLADDMALKPWLQNIIWPVEKKYISEEFVRDGTELAIAEMELHVAQIRLNEMCRKEGDLSDKYMEGDDLAYENHDHLAGEGDR